ncbi:glycosyltransferase [Actinoplanes sp. CA-051413]|uniref:glycosyltransferase n=1 Tax=Actinoplanes sp. CA-051413 TaxID=3239899 RepID=UPI003D9837B5
MATLTVGVHVHAEPARLLATLAALDAALPAGAAVMLLPDGPDAETARALARHPVLSDLPQSGTSSPGGPPACFNRLAAAADGGDIILLESGARPAPDALTTLAAALASSARIGLAGPSTNRCWNEQAVLPAASGSADGLVAAARAAHRRHGRALTPLTPLHSLADFCFAVRADVIAAVGAADEGFGLGPCWEMEYSARAARAGFVGVWVGAAFVHRAPSTRRRDTEEPRRFAASRRRYQDRLCGLRLDGTADGYREHCAGDACDHFAPADRIRIRLPLPDQTPPAAGQHPAAKLSGPVTTCVLPTADRTDFLRQAVRYLRRQDDPSWELIIVNDGEHDSRAAIGAEADDSRITWLRPAQSLSIGHKRNLACEQARGEFIAQWDDDDWYGPARLRTQVAPLLAGDADITALRDAVWFDVRRWRFRVPTPAAHRRLFVGDVHGGTLVFRRSVWQRQSRYPDQSLAEDAFLLRGALNRGARLAALPAAGHFLYVRHATNSWRLHDGSETSARGWREVTEPAELGADREFYTAVGAGTRAGAVAAGPLVSCLMPTADRREFVPSAIRCFLDQSYPDRELVVVDDGRDPVRDIVAGAGVRYVRLDRRTVLGTKRNIAAETARGDVLVHWDDDDWSHPDRLARQAAALTGRIDVCGLDDLLWWDADRSRVWRYRYPGRGRPWAAGNTLAYRRQAWRRAPFRPLSVGEDTAFIWGPGRFVVLPLHDPSLVIGIIHAHNSSPKITTGPGWSPAPTAAVTRIVGRSPGWWPATEACTAR